MKAYFSTFARLWHKSPRFAAAFVFRKFFRKAKHLLPKDDWNGNWLGEEMRPFNSMR